MKFLIIKTSSLGDIIHAFPVLDYLKNKFPNCQIDWVVESQFSELVRSHPLVQRTLCVNTKKWRKSWLNKEHRNEMQAFCRELKTESYDAVFDLQGNVKSGLITFMSKSKNKVGFAKKTVPESPNCLFTNIRFNPPPNKNIREDYLNIVLSYFKDSISGLDFTSSINLKITPEQKNQIQAVLESSLLANREKIMICPGSAWKNKQLDDKTLQDLLLQFKNHRNCSFLLVWGTQDEKKIAEQLNVMFPDCSIVVERLSLPCLQNLMKEMNLVIAMDSLPLHLAGIAGVSTYSIFGSSLADKYKPLGSQHRTYQGSCPYNKTFAKRCPILRTCSTGACIRSLNSEDLYNHYTDK